MSKIIIAGNWKMHGSKVELTALLEKLTQLVPVVPVDVETVVFAPFPYLYLTESLCKGTSLAYGGQNMSEFTHGAYTGEVSGAMLSDFGCQYVLLGHSERRHVFGETDTRIAAKFIQAQACGLVPMLCVGETLAEREAGITADVIQGQLRAVIEQAGIESLKNTILAYEPVWAIGTGKTASPEQAQVVHAEIRQFLGQYDENIAKNVSVLYGGSVKSANAAELLAMPDINGLLVGGASLVAESFAEIIDAAKLLRG